MWRRCRHDRVISVCSGDSETFHDGGRDPKNLAVRYRDNACQQMVHFSEEPPDCSSAGRVQWGPVLRSRQFLLSGRPLCFSRRDCQWIPPFCSIDLCTRRNLIQKLVIMETTLPWLRADYGRFPSMFGEILYKPQNPEDPRHTERRKCV